MAAEPQEPDRTLGSYSEGRITELSVSMHELSRRLDTGLTEVNQRLDTGLAEVNHRLETGLAEVNRRLDTGLAEVNRRIDRLFLAILAIGGGIIAALVGLLVTQIIQGR